MSAEESATTYCNEKKKYIEQRYINIEKAESDIEVTFPRAEVLRPPDLAAAADGEADGAGTSAETYLQFFITCNEKTICYY